MELNIDGNPVTPAQAVVRTLQAPTATQLASLINAELAALFVAFASGNLANVVVSGGGAGAQWQAHIYGDDDGTDLYNAYAVVGFEATEPSSLRTQIERALAAPPKNTLISESATQGGAGSNLGAFMLFHTPTPP